MSPDVEAHVLVELGKLIGKVDDVQTAQAAMKRQLEDGDDRFTSVEVGLAEVKGELQQMVAQQKIANGRTGKLEQLLEQLAKRIGLLEQWRRTVNFLPRMIDKLGEHKIFGLVLTVPITSALTIAVYKLFA